MMLSGDNFQGVVIICPEAEAKKQAKELRRHQHVGPFPPKTISPKSLKKQNRQNQVKNGPHPEAWGEFKEYAYKTSLHFINRRCVMTVVFEAGLVFHFGGYLPRYEDDTIFNPPSCLCSRGWHRGNGEYNKMKGAFYTYDEEHSFGNKPILDYCCSHKHSCIGSMKSGLCHVPSFELKHKACVAHQGLPTLQGFKSCKTHECNKVVVFGSSGRSQHCIEHLLEYKREKDSIWQDMTEQVIPNHWLIPVPLKDSMKFLLEGEKQSALDFSEKKWRREEAIYQVALKCEIALCLEECVILDIAKMIETYL